VCPTEGYGAARDLREMGSAEGKGVREGQAPQTRSKISSQLPARKEVTWSRRKKERRARREEEDLACTE
jgi:hypothetical protein